MKDSGNEVGVRVIGWCYFSSYHNEKIGIRSESLFWGKTGVFEWVISKGWRMHSFHLSGFSLKCEKMKCSIEVRFAALEHHWRSYISLLIELENKISCWYCGGVESVSNSQVLTSNFFRFAEAGRGIDNWYGFAEVLFSISLKVKLFRWKILSLIELIIESKRIATAIISRRSKEAN